MKIFLFSVFFFCLFNFILGQDDGSRCTNPMQPLYNASGNNCIACPDETPFWSVFVSKCVAACPIAASAYDAAKWCKKCPSDYPAWDLTTLSCIKCSGIKDKYDRYNAQCVETCPDYAPKLNTSNAVCLACGNETKYWDATLAECVANCTFPTPVADINGRCQPCGSSTPYWDYNPQTKTGLCLTTCPVIRAKNLNKECQACSVDTPNWNPDTQLCEICPSPAPYYYSQMGKCVPRCADANYLIPTYNFLNFCVSCGGLYWDNINSVCVNPCPRQAPKVNTRSWCETCTAPTPKWDSISKICTDTCPTSIPDTDSDGWCIACSRNKPFWSIDNSKCEICPTETPYWDTSSGTGTCVATCPASHPLVDSDKWCMSCPSSSRYWDTYSSSGSCATVCPAIAPLSDTNNWCRACEATTPYWNSATSSCLVNCPPSKPIIDSTKWCHACPSTTPKWDPARSECVVTCPPETPATDSNNVCIACSVSTPTTPILDPSISSCVASCEGLAPILNGNKCEYCPSNLPNWDSSIPACVSSCPVEKPYLNPYKWCKACEGSTPYWNSLISACVTTCPQTHPNVDSNKWCKACPIANPKWDPVAVACLTNCPAVRPVITSYNWCQACPIGTPFWKPTNSACTASCPSQTPMADANNWCIACPNFTPKWDSIPATCIANCPPSRPVTGSYNWCKACPTEAPYWNSTKSACMASCPPEAPMKDANNWCKACPSITPYWDPVLAICVSRCPQDTPFVDLNKHCRPCPAKFPTWNEVTMQCLEACPLDRPVMGTNNWCQECPSSTSYWDTINRVCVDLCPPQIPSVSPGNWCKECTDATVKWDPIISGCVAACPKELPFFNKNSVPPACEKGPNVQDIVNFLETSGVVVPVTLGVIQLAMPGLPYAAVTILLMSLLKYVRYFNINFPDKLSKVLQQGSLNIPSLNFGPLFPEDWKLDTYSHPAPYRFAQYDISGLFVANFWRGISTALIIAAGVGLMQILVRRKLTNEKVILVREKAKNFLILNYVLSFFISNIANLTLYMFIEYQSLYFHDGLGTGSFLLNLISVQITLFGLVYMIKRIKEYHKLNKQARRNDQKIEIDESIQVLLKKFNDEHLIQLLFIPILCIRAIINAIIMSTVNDPIIQCSLLIILNLFMIVYNIRYHPHRLIVDNTQIIGYEAILLVVNITCLHLATLSFDEQFAAEQAGEILINSNILMFALSFVFTLTKIILYVIKMIKERYRLKRPSSNISIQTDDSSAIELTPTSEKCARLETAISCISPGINKKPLDLSFAGSVSMEVAIEGEQSPGVAERNFNSNDIKRSFHAVRIPEGAEESQHLSRYVDTGV